MFTLSAKVQSILFSADFSAENDPNVRQFTTIAEDICNGGEGFPDELICPHGLGFFASSIDVAAVDPGRTFIGPPILNGARQSYILWDGTDPAGTFTEDAWDVFVATVAWTVTDKNPADSTIRWATYSEDFANGVITVAPDPVDAEVISRLEAVGYNVVPTWQCCGDEQTNFTSLMPLNVNASDLDILSEHAQVLHHPQWLGSPIPLMMWQGSMHQRHRRLQSQYDRQAARDGATVGSLDNRLGRGAPGHGWQDGNIPMDQYVGGTH